jgi:hypothetical protein
MGFDDFFEDKRKHQGNFREHGYHDNYDDNRYSQNSYPSYHGNNNHQKWVTILDKIRSNNKLKLIVVIAGIVILVIAIILIIALLPLIIKLLNYISQNGLQGILDGITGFLDKLWKGSGK